MKIDCDILVSLNGYIYSEDYDNWQFKSLVNQSNKDFSILYIDPHKLESRKNRLLDIENNYGIKTYYLPYEIDYNPRKYDWTTRNIACLFIDNYSRFFNYWQNRSININLIDICKKFESNIGFLRIWLDQKYIYPPNHDEILEYSVVGKTDKNKLQYIYDKGCFEKQINLNEIKTTNNLKYCFYDALLYAGDFLQLNGTDEALTSWKYEEDWDIEERWGVATKLNLLHDVIWIQDMMVYHGCLSRRDAILHNRTKADLCKNCLDNEQIWIKEINNENKKQIDGLIYLGIINNYIEWWKCNRCNQLYPKVGVHGWGDFTDRQSEFNIYKASIGIDGRYGRNLNKIKNKIYESDNFEESIKILNNSWSNKDFFDI